MSGFYIEAGGFQHAAAINARRPTCQRWNDMPAALPLAQEIAGQARDEAAMTARGTNVVLRDWARLSFTGSGARATAKKEK